MADRFLWRTLTAIAVLLWAWSLLAQSTRYISLLLYLAYRILPPAWEPIGGTLGAFAVTLAVLGVWCRLSISCFALSTRQCLVATGILLLAGSLTPLLSLLGRSEPPFLENLWLPIWTGIAFAVLLRGRVESLNSAVLFPGLSSIPINHQRGLTIVLASAVGMTWYWYNDAVDAWLNFRLGFNDFGHFTWRLQNSWNGNGWLVETPVLPRFWDHCNPGISFLIPFWGYLQNPRLIFFVHALSLTAIAPLLFVLLRQLNIGVGSSIAWSLTWLVHPVISQFNLAYTYGWHPVTLAVLPMLASLIALMAHRYFLCASLALLAASMEEGVFIVYCLVCFFQGVWSWQALRQQSPEDSNKIHQQLSPLTWLLLAAAWAIGFVAVYRFSGLAEFQTARFAKLGNSTTAVVLSPVLNPQAFWGQIFQSRCGYFLLGVLGPIYLPAVVRGWRWMMPTILPLVVLLAWDHQPATSLAFHYTTLLFLCFFLSIVTGTRREDAMAASSAALVSALVASVTLGAVPWSSPTLVEVQGKTYGLEHASLRRIENPDGRWIHTRINRLNDEDQLRVLATGRLAGHFLTADFLETVGQYLERRERLKAWSGLERPIELFDTIVIDRRERLQQTTEQVREIEAEAKNAGFAVTDEGFDFVIYRRAKAS